MKSDQLAAIALSMLPKISMDVIIVVTSNSQQEAFWQERLTAPASNHFHSAKIVVVHEDWPGGAGNGLGTLYAYQKAIAKAKKLYGIDLAYEQENGAAIAMYHTAGKGTRLAPLPGSEGNNKSAVKLPSLQDSIFVTILESVIRQTSLYAEGRRGRLSVFWGDQIFIPASAPIPSTHHADILGCLAPLPTREEWNAKGLSRYGLLAVARDGKTKLLDKVSYNTIQRLIEEGVVAHDTLFGTSLGSFSVSFELLCCLLEEFSAELSSRNGKLDSDPHLWMPMTLDERIYVEAMSAKGMSEDDAKRHHKRMQKLGNNFFLETIDVGQGSYWWDFGSIKTYYNNCLKLTNHDAEGAAMRTFFGGSQYFDIDQNSYVQGCQIRSGNIRNSVLIGVQAEHLDISDTVIINSCLTDLKANDCLLYNVKEPHILAPESGTVRADVPNSDIQMLSHVNRDGSRDWNECLNGNIFSYAELYSLNEDAR